MHQYVKLCQCGPNPLAACPGQAQIAIAPTTVLIQLTPGEGRNIQVRVTIPVGTDGGDTETTDFTATSQSEPSVFATANLTTTAL